MEKDWKKGKTAKTILDRATAAGADKWEVFEYFAKKADNEAGLKIFRELFSAAFDIEEIFDHYTLETLENLGSAVSDYIKTRSSALIRFCSYTDREEYVRLVLKSKEFYNEEFTIDEMFDVFFKNGKEEERRKFLKEKLAADKLDDIIKILIDEGKTIEQLVDILQKHSRIDETKIIQALTKKRFKEGEEGKEGHYLLTDLFNEGKVNPAQTIRDLNKTPRLAWFLVTKYTPEQIYQVLSYKGKLSYDEVVLLTEDYPTCVGRAIKKLPQIYASKLVKIPAHDDSKGEKYYNELYKLFASSKAFEESLVRMIKKSLISPENILKITPDVDKLPEIVQTYVEAPWKLEREPRMILKDCKTDGEKWERLDWFAKNQPTTFRTLTTSKYFGRTAIKNHYRGRKDIPVEVQKLFNEEEEKIKAAQLRREDAAEARKSFYDEAGTFKCFFTIGKLKPESEQDYVTIFRQFEKSNLTIPAFCGKYKISSVEGFRKMLELLALNDEKLAEDIKQVGLNNQKRVFGKTITAIENIAEGKVDIGKFISEAPISSNFNLGFFISQARENCPHDIAVKFTKNILNYFQERMGQFDGTFAPEKVSKMLTRKEFAFLKGEEKIKPSSLQEDRQTLGDIVFKITSFMNREDQQFFRDKLLNPKSGIRAKLSLYHTKFNADVYLAEKPRFIIDGQEIYVTEEMIGKASIFIHMHKLCPTINVYKTVIRAVMLGQITDKDLQVETGSDSAEQIKAKIDKVGEARNVDEYFDAFDDEESSI